MVRNVRRHFNVGDALLVIYDVVAVVSDLSLGTEGIRDLCLVAVKDMEITGFVSGTCRRRVHIVFDDMRVLSRDAATYISVGDRRLIVVCLRAEWERKQCEAEPWDKSDVHMLEHFHFESPNPREFARCLNSQAPLRATGRRGLGLH